MDFIKSTLGRENDSGVDEPVEAEGGFLRDWILPSTAFATENSSATWNPLSNLLGASSPVSAQDQLVMTTAERMRWRWCLDSTFTFRRMTTRAAPSRSSWRWLHASSW